MSLILLIVSVLLFVSAYRFYGRFLERRCKVDPDRVTPACEVDDGVDYVPTRASIVFGHHFSSIAGAGPIVGPIIAASLFGWLPTWVWIVAGTIFVGGVHDFGSTLMSLRYRGQSITATCRDLIGEKTGKLFLVFVLLALVYVIVVFLDLTVVGFVEQPAVASASGWFIFVALLFGWATGKAGVPFKVAMPVCVLLSYLGLWVGIQFPFSQLDKTTWTLLVLIYCYCAAILPVRVLMQPRDFLSATYLYAVLLLGIFGLIIRGGGFDLPAYTGFRPEDWSYLAPMLFITVACGACSGFHSIVSSGTTSKQIRTERDVRRVTYGSMLVEGLLAVFALACVGVSGSMEGGPIAAFARGSSAFFGSLGIPEDMGVAFATLAVSTFLLTTLDTCTRLTRFLMEELFDWHTQWSRYLGTLIVLVVPAVAALVTFKTPEGVALPAWKAIWPLFGATNQLLAALALTTFLMFLKDRGIRHGFVVLPTLVMVVMPVVALLIIVLQYGLFSLLGCVALGMVVLGVYMVTAAARHCFIGGVSKPFEYRMDD